MTKEEFLDRLEIARAWAEWKRVERQSTYNDMTWRELSEFSEGRSDNINFFDPTYNFRLRREPKVIWVNEYAGGERVLHSSKERAIKLATMNVVRTAVRYVEDMTNE